MITLCDLLWSGRKFVNHYDNQNYHYVFEHSEFLETLRFHPEDLTVKDIRDIVVNFLNKWGCRLRNYDDSTAIKLREHIIKAHPVLLALQHKSIFDLDSESLKEKIENAFNTFWFYGSAITKNYGPTATSKTLHIINPELFTMWDDKIRLFYWVNNNEIIDSGRGYYFFLLEIKKIAESLADECQREHATRNVALWVSQQLNINPPMSIVKFIDEYNWIRYTKGLQRPENSIY